MYFGLPTLSFLQVRRNPDEVRVLGPSVVYITTLTTEAVAKTDPQLPEIKHQSAFIGRMFPVVLNDVLLALGAQLVGAFKLGANGTDGM